MRKKVVLLSAITTFIAASILFAVKPILFTKADNCVSSSPTGCGTPQPIMSQQSTDIPQPSQAQPSGNTTSVIASSPQPTATPLPTQTTQVQSTQPQSNSCHQVCQEVCQ